MHYRVGYCPQCGTQIMVQNTDGRWNSWKKNFRQGNIIFGNGTRVRTIICDQCLNTPDLDKLVESITDRQSDACVESVALKIKSLGAPLRMEIYTTLGRA